MGRTVFASNSRKERVVGVALGTGCVEGCFVRGIERGVFAETFGKIWIG